MDCSVLNIYDRDGNVDEVYQALLKQYNDNQAEALKAYLAGFQKPNEVNYTFKSVDILMSDKAKQVFEKGKKNGWDLNKILTELQVPKEQKQIILDKNISNREEIVTSLLADNSFTVEINTAKAGQIDEIKTPNDNVVETDRETYIVRQDNKYYESDDLTNPFDEWVEVDKSEFDRFYKSTDNPSQIYSNLTVPGGTNYTENEIATPAITPSIKGHAQFATNQGIGWFRSDDRAIKDESPDYNTILKERLARRPNESEENYSERMWDFEYKVSEYFDLQSDNPAAAFQYPTEKQKIQYLKEINEASKNSYYIKASKTRRILEVQSDLFQKGRNNEILAGTDPRAKRLINATQEQENFLQLLNKNNNWVTFFTKSIIQDSAKKGYEKVLFPKGDTAAKIEGHQTLEEFKKVREKEIKKSQEKITEYDKIINRKLTEEDNVFGTPDIRKAKEQKKSAKAYIDTLKQELADVESGQTQLSSIANFYEKTVTNILKKQGYNPVEITDEYGNKWNEVSIEPEYKTSSIQFATGNVFGSESTANELELKHKLKNKKGEYKRYSPRGKSWDNLIEKRKEVNSQLPDGFKTVLKKAPYNGGPVKYTLKIEKSAGSRDGIQYMKRDIVKPGVEGLFKSNAELADIGTQQQYSQYLNTIFPDSKVKEIVYHKTSSKEIEGGKFKISRLGGVYFSFFDIPSGGLLKGLFQKLIKENTIFAVVNVKNPFIINRNNAKEVIKKTGLTTQDVTKLRKNFDLSTNDAILGFPNETKDTGQLDNFPTISFNEKDRKDIIELAVFEPEQIHILGSKQDIGGFKEFVNNNPSIQYMKKEGLEHLKHPLDLQIYSLKNERNKLWRDEVDTGVDHSSRIAELNEQIDELNTQKRDIGSNTKAQDVLNQWSKYSKRLSDIVNKSDITASEIWEGKKIYELWKAITDVDSTKNPVFEDGELAYKLVDGEPDNELVKELSAIRSQVELAGNQLQNIKMEVIRKNASDELGKSLSVEEVTRAIQDINTIAKGSLNLGQVNHPIIQAVWKSLNRVKNRATTNTQDKFEELDTKLEAAKQSTGMSFKEIFQLFREKFKNGDYTTDMVDRFTPEFKMKRDEVRGKMNELLYDLQKKDLGKNVKKQLEKQWNNLHKWRQDNLYTIDINALFPDIQVNDDMQIPDEYLNKPKVDVTPEQVKQRVLELVDGDEEQANKLINLQERKVREFRAKRYKKWVELNENTDIKEPALAFEKWLKINDPYKVDDIKFNGWNKPNFYHNIQINKNPDNINTQYDRIKNNKELKDLHQTYKDIIYEVGIITHESKYTGGWMSGNSLPFLTKSVTDKLFEGGKLMGSDLFHQIKSIVAEVETGEEDYYTDPVTGEKIKKIQNKSVANKEETITRRLKRKVLVAEQEKGIGLTVEEIANLRSEVLNEMAGEQSIDIHKLMKLMVANGEATKQKQTIEDQVKLVQEYFNTEYKGAEIKRSGALSKTPADVGNIKDLLNFTLDNEFYGYNTKKTEGRYSKIRTAEEKKQVEALENKLKELNQKEPTTEDEKIELAKEKEAIRNEIKSIGMTATLSRSLDSLLKWVQLKAMAWQPLSAVANLNFGALTNIIEAADGRSFGFKELGIGYKAAVSGDKKLRNIMRRWNMLNNQANELYNRTTESTFLKNMQAVAPYKLIESTEWVNQAPILRAMMEKRKAITPDGKKVNMWEAYTEEGKLKEGYSLSEKGGDQADLEANLISAVKRMVELGHGDYYHKQYAKQFILGRLGMQFRTWMAEGFNNRFMAEKPEELLGYTRKGRYLSYKKSHFIPVIGQLQLIKDGLQAIRNNYTANGDPANIEVDSANLRKNMVELAFAVAMFTAGLIMRHAMIDDDEEREGFSRYALNFFINQSTRLQTELWFYINPMEFERLNKNVLPVMRVLKDVSELFDAHTRFIDDRETSIQSGPFEGMNWATREWLEFIPPFTVPMRVYRQTYDILE